MLTGVQWSRENNLLRVVYWVILVPLFYFWNHNRKQITISWSSSLQISFINNFSKIQLTGLIDHEYSQCKPLCMLVCNQISHISSFLLTGWVNSQQLSGSWTQPCVKGSKCTKPHIHIKYIYQNTFALVISNFGRKGSSQCALIKSRMGRATLHLMKTYILLLQMCILVGNVYTIFPSQFNVT